MNGTSLDTQEKRCRAFSELHGFKIDKVYSEIVSGGVEFRKRKIFQKVLKDIKSERILIEFSYKECKLFLVFIYKFNYILIS